MTRIRISKVVAKKSGYMKMLISLRRMQICRVHVSLNDIEYEIV